jgi:hypothetical protein
MEITPKQTLNRAIKSFLSLFFKIKEGIKELKIKKEK